MSNSYTHKIILFSNAGFNGEALVVLDNTFEEKDTIDNLDKLGWKNKPQSAICEKGGWRLGGAADKLNICRDVYGKECAFQSNFTNIYAVHATLALERDSEPVPDRKPKSSSAPTPPTSLRFASNGDQLNSTPSTAQLVLESSETPTYSFKFYPEYNSYKISPSPVHSYSVDMFAKDYLITGAPDAFRWIFKDGDILEFDWRGESIEKVHIDFSPYFYSSRTEPVTILSNEGNATIKNGILSTTGKVKVKIAVSESHYDEASKTWIGDGAMWSFDFCCTIKGRHYRIDPTIKVGTGSDRRL